MAKGFNAVLLRTMGARSKFLTVTGSTEINSRYLRVHFTSDGFLKPEGERPGDWLRLWVPDPEGSSKQYQRGYTIRHADPETGAFDIDFVIHEPLGPAAAWATSVQPGETVEAMRLSEKPFEPLDPPPAGYLFLGDLASYPATMDIVADVPDDAPVLILMESHDPVDKQMPLPEGPNITAAWIDEQPGGQALVRAIEGRDLSGWYARVCAESTATRLARTYLQREFGLNKATMHSQAYWIRGRSMGKDRDLPDGDDAQVETTPTEQHGAVEETSISTTDVLKPARAALWGAGIAQALISVAEVVPFILFAEIARLFLVGGTTDQFLRTGVIALVVLGLTSAATFLLMLILHFYDARFSAALRRRLLDTLSRLPLGWFSRRDRGEVKRLVGEDVGALHHLVVHAVADAVAAVVTPLAVLIYLFTVEWRLALVLLVPIVIYVGVMARLLSRDRDNVMMSQRWMGRLSTQAQTFLDTHQVARVFGSEAVVDLPSNLKDYGDFLLGWQRDTVSAKVFAILVNRPAVVFGLLTAAGAGFIALGWSEPSTLIPFLILGTSFGSRLLAISYSVSGLVAGMSARRSLELFLATPTLSDLKDAQGPGESHGRVSESYRIHFDHVSFSYTPDRPILQDFSITVEPGTTTALVGPSGAGKSTVAALIARMWDPQSGSVSIGGRDIRDFDQDELYSTVSLLLQDVDLVRGTVADNIALARPDASRQEIEQAAVAAAVHDEIQALPDGYDTVVTSARLSGGQRQRIGIARALLADAPIVVLDEATASADPDSEWAIRQGLSVLLKDRTVILVAHRLHTLTGADRILVMDSGRIIEDGTHPGLISRGGRYAKMWADAERARLGASDLTASVGPRPPEPNDNEGTGK